MGVQTIYSDLKRRASEQAFVLIGTPGSVGEREVRGRAFLYRQFYDARGKKSAEYLGPLDDKAARKRAESIREAIEVANGLLGDARLLAREGYVRVESRTNAIIASLANHGMFRAGALLVGSHAFGALVNELGIKSKIAGRDRLRVDLLTPSSGRDLDYVLSQSIETVIIGRESVVPVRVPRPERFALHKLWVAQMRGATNEKRTKDIHQGAVLVAALAETEVGALEEAFAAFPKSARTKLRSGLKQAHGVLVREGHERGADVLDALR